MAVLIILTVLALGLIYFAVGERTKIVIREDLNSTKKTILFESWFRFWPFKKEILLKRLDYG